MQMLSLIGWPSRLDPTVPQQAFKRQLGFSLHLVILGIKKRGGEMIFFPSVPWRMSNQFLSLLKGRIKLFK